MAHGFNNRVWCDTATTGTGNVTIGSPKPAHCTPAQAGTVNGDTRTWLLEEGNDFEIFRGAYTATGTVVTRGTVLLSQIAGATGTTRMTLAGTATIREVSAAEDLLSIVVPADARSALGLSFATRAITGTDTIVASDLGKTLLFNSSSAFTEALTAAATLGTGFWCNVRNIGTALVTLDPNSSETIDGKTTMTVGLNEAFQIVCNGTAFFTDASNGKLVELARVTNPNAGTVDFDFASGWPADFDEFEIHLDNVQPATNDTYLGMRIKTTASLTVATAGYNYAGRFQGGTGSDFSHTSDSITDRAAISKPGSGQGLGSGTGYYLNGEIKIKRPNDVAPQARFDGSYIRYSDGILISISVSGYYASNVAWTGIRFLMSSGNILNGSIVLLARRK